MADFPTTKHTFTNFANGATTDAAQVTDIYAEVEAIEDGYLNATARLNSSNSTLANLSVPGGSTLAALHVTSTATFDSSVTFSGNVTITGALTAASLSRGFVLATGSTSPFPNVSTASVGWPTHTAISNSSLHSTATNPDRFFPQSTGLWALSVSVALAGNYADPSSGVIEISIKDSSGGMVEFRRTDASAAGQRSQQSAYGMKYFDTLSATPYLRAVLLQRGSASSNSAFAAESFARFYQL
jgi:hypothetical protein